MTAPTEPGCPYDNAYHDDPSGCPSCTIDPRPWPDESPTPTTLDAVYQAKAAEWPRLGRTQYQEGYLDALDFACSLTEALDESSAAESSAEERARELLSSVSIRMRVAEAQADALREQLATMERERVEYKLQHGCLHREACELTRTLTKAEAENTRLRAALTDVAKDMREVAEREENAPQLWGHSPGVNPSTVEYWADAIDAALAKEPTP